MAFSQRAGSPRQREIAPSIRWFATSLMSIHAAIHRSRHGDIAAERASGTPVRGRSGYGPEQTGARVRGRQDAKEGETGAGAPAEFELDCRPRASPLRELLFPPLVRLAPVRERLAAAFFPMMRNTRSRAAQPGLLIGGSPRLTL